MPSDLFNGMHVCNVNFLVINLLISVSVLPHDSIPEPMCTGSPTLVGIYLNPSYHNQLEFLIIFSAKEHCFQPEPLVSFQGFYGFAADSMLGVYIHIASSTCSHPNFISSLFLFFF